jgi:nitroimidazol reductase NimA-like FMN-containing flavoprotein (pyridoxamine 5'-phosphate oxidase superfamily)
MRRADRLIIEPDALREVLARCDVLRLGLVDDGCAYIVPMNFGYDASADPWRLYLHCAAEGRKIRVLRENPVAAFEMDTGHRLVVDDTACRATFDYLSLMGEGTVRFLETSDEKRACLDHIMRHMTGRDGWTYEDAILARVTALELTVSSISGKRHISG